MFISNSIIHTGCWICHELQKFQPAASSEVGNFHDNIWFHSNGIGWNLGLTWKIATCSIMMWPIDSNQPHTFPVLFTTKMSPSLGSTDWHAYDAHQNSTSKQKHTEKNPINYARLCFQRPALDTGWITFTMETFQIPDWVLFHSFWDECMSGETWLLESN